MSLRPPAGFIRPGYNPLEVPDAPTIGTATGGDAQADVTFTAPSNVGGAAITAYYAVSSPGQITTSGTASPITVTGLSNGTAYTFQVWALNSYGPSPYSAASGSVSPVASIGLFAGGIASVEYNVIEQITISTTGNSTDFGDLITVTYGMAGCGSSTRGVFGGGRTGGDLRNVISYVTFSSAGNATDFGDLLYAPETPGAASNQTRGLFACGFAGGNASNINYITIASVGDATDFGDLIAFSDGSATGNASSTRALFTGEGNVIQYVTISTTGNSTDFGDLTLSRTFTGGASSSTRATFAGGNASGVSNVIDYVTIATTGNATDFGDLTIARERLSGCSSSSRGVFGGGLNQATSTSYNVMDYITIATTGNATDFGDLSAARYWVAACSNAHGGL